MIKSLYDHGIRREWVMVKDEKRTNLEWQPVRVLVTKFYPRYQRHPHANAINCDINGNAAKARMRRTFWCYLRF